MKTLGIFGWILLCTSISVLLGSWAMSTLWLWFAADQYGPGPSMGGWYGLALIARLALHRDSDLGESVYDADEAFSKAVRHAIGYWVAILVTLGISWAFGSVVGWIH